MKANVRAIQQNDEGVSPVIAVILMVAITVVLAATVYVWVSGFASDSGGPESASATARGFDSDDDGDVDTIRVTLVRGENAPYTTECLDGAGAAVAAGVACNNAWDSASEFIISGSAPAPTSAIDAADLGWSAGTTALLDGDNWDVGESLFIDCGAAGEAAVTVSVGRGDQKTTILDSTVSCDE